MTDSIESLGHPLVYPLANPGIFPASAPARKQVVSVRTYARALEGMQKEAVVRYGDGDQLWRMVCDEGPYLNGTDLAPPPLAYFSAGMAAFTASALVREAQRLNTKLAGLTITQDNKFSMEGSLARGTMVGGALPVELEVKATIASSETKLMDLLRGGMSRSPVDALMREALVDVFSLTRNGAQIETGEVARHAGDIPANPAELFSALQCPPEADFNSEITTKLDEVESVFEADHGQGASLKDAQKRELHIRSHLILREDGLKDIRVQIFKPIGSVFRFLADDPATVGGTCRAPTGLAYLSAGIAFCYMTQIQRYSQMAKRTVDAYGLVQDTAFDFAENRTHPVETHVFMETPEDESSTRQIIDMAEQTCFLHAACRLSNKTRIRAGTK